MVGSNIMEDKLVESINPPLFEEAVRAAKLKVEKEISLGIDVPIPKDMGGGYTHERHKLNYRIMHYAGDLYRLNGDVKYAEYIKNMLVEYAKIFKSLPIHPTNRSYATGKIFWQCLNDANWLVYTSQAYDAIYDYLSEEERNYLESELLRPYADFISIENPQFFNRVHNHSTWGNAGVGMMGLAMKDDELLERALYGLKLDKNNDLAKDNDGGFIYEKGKSKAGFFAQMDYAFSPDGYYTEGPYYQRYAMLPFMAFANEIEKKRPDLKIFEYRDGLLIKAVKALLYQTNSEGEFFPINDAAKGMSIKAGSVITAVDIAYGASKDPVFAQAAKLQNEVLIDNNGLAVAKAVSELQDPHFQKKPIELKDGKDGTEGALGILRSGEGNAEMNLVFKYTAQGLGHGHYDKLSYSLYDGSTEVMQDYGAARWVNIDQKAGGRYLPENKTWAKQTIAHNTLVVDQKSHFGGKYDIATDKYSEPIYFNVSNSNLQIASAREVNAYEGVEMARLMILWKDEYFAKPVVIDLFDVYSSEQHTYDMPFQFAGQIMSQNFEYIAAHPEKMGENHGYQHIYKEAEVTPKMENAQLNWFKHEKFYTLTSILNDGDKVMLARVGATDPNHNLRHDPLMILRRENSSNSSFVTVIESHGTYSPVTEVPLQPYGKIDAIRTLINNRDYAVIEIQAKEDMIWTIYVSKLDGGNEASHEIEIDGKKHNWSGPIHIIEN